MYSDSPYISYKEIAKHLPIVEGDNLYFVSDLSRLMALAIKNENEFKPDLLINSFTEVIKTGNLCIPGFVNTIKKNGIVDIRSLKPETGGLSKIAFKDFKLGKCVRTNDPFHSFFIYGPSAQKIVDLTFNNKSTFGDNSVFGYLHKQNAKLVLVDLELYYGFTFAHYVEQCIKVAYRYTELFPLTFTNINGDTSKEVFKIFAKRKGFIPTLNGLIGSLLKAQAAVNYSINNIPILIIDLDKAYNVISDDYKNNKAKNLIRFDFKLYLKQTLKQFAN